MPRRCLRAGLLAGASVAVSGVSAFAQTNAPEQVVIEGARSVAMRDMLPTTVESISIDDLRAQVNVTNTEDALKYLPDIVVRKRHVGDTQAPISTRTSGVGASARSLVYADGVLLSALIGNNNSFASPRWGIVSPEEIARVDVLYGPFSAAYPGNSIGAVVEIATRLPDGPEGSLLAQGSVQPFEQYGTDLTAYSGRAAATWGDRHGPLAWFLSANHLSARSQPLAYVT